MAIYGELNVANNIEWQRAQAKRAGDTVSTTMAAHDARARLFSTASGVVKTSGKECAANIVSAQDVIACDKNWTLLENNKRFEFWLVDEDKVYFGSKGLELYFVPAGKCGRFTTFKTDGSIQIDNRVLCFNTKDSSMQAQYFFKGEIQT